MARHPLGTIFFDPDGNLILPGCMQNTISCMQLSGKTVLHKRIAECHNRLLLSKKTLYLGFCNDLTGEGQEREAGERGLYRVVPLSGLWETTIA
jgi:hypothetical protein